LGLKQVADLEPKPGMPPSPGHLQRLLDGLRGQPLLAVVTSGYQDPRPARWLSTQLGEKVGVLMLPATVPEDADGEGLLRWYDGLLTSLLQAAR
jgi:zinc/manganese transport system substrate-binding protein